MKIHIIGEIPLCTSQLQILFSYMSSLLTKLTQERKRDVVIVSLAEDHSDVELEIFLKVTLPFFFKVRSELKAVNLDVATI